MELNRKGSEASATAARDAIEMLYSPTSVVVVGASADESKFGGRVMRNLVRYGYQGAIYPVNRSGEPILGVPSFKAIPDIPGQVELAVIAVPGGSVPAVIEACAERGVKAAVVVSSGFAEVGAAGEDEQRRLLALGRRLGVRLLGPNSLGLYHAHNRIAATANQVFDRMLEPGDVGLLSQSGALGGSLLDAGMDQGLRFSSFISIGNGADLEIPDLLPYQVNDPTCKVILLYIEGIRDFGKLSDGLAEARRLGKPVVILRAGWSVRGASAIQSHTGSMAGSRAAYEAVFNKHRAIVVDDVQEALDAAKAATMQGQPGNRIGFVSVSGGLGSLAADRCEDLDLELSQLEADTVARLKQVLPAFAPTENPLDVTGAITSTPGLMGRVLSVVADDANVDSIVVLVTVVYGSERIAKEIAEVAREFDKPVLAVVCGGMVVGEAKRILAESDVPVFSELYAGLRALARVVRAGRVDYSDSGPRLEISELDETSRIAVVDALGTSEDHDMGDRLLSEPQSKSVLALCGVPICPEAVVQTLDEALATAAEFNYPLVLKGVTDRIAHKAKAGLVKLNLCNEVQLTSAFGEIRAAAEAVDVQLDGVLLQPMAAAGIELLVGGFRDPQAGPLIAFGLGGVFTEALHQVTFRPAPLSEAEAMEMVREIPALAALTGNVTEHLAPLASILIKVSDLLVAVPTIGELDINPLIYYPDRQQVVAVDGLIRRMNLETVDSEEHP